MRDRTVLIGFMATPSGIDGAELGRLLAEVTDATPVVATVIPPRRAQWGEDEQQSLEQAARDAFADVKQRSFQHMEPIFELATDTSAADRLQQLAVKHDAEMIVLGSAHRGAVGRTLAGSTGTALLHGAPCAVAVAPRGFAESEQRRLQNIAVAFDGSPESWSALNAAINLGESVHGKLTVLVSAEPPVYGYHEVLGVLSGEGLHTAAVSERNHLAELALARIPVDLPAERRLLMGGAGRVLADASSDFDLLVCGSRGWGPLRRTVLGSTAAHLIGHAGCPVLVIERGAVLDGRGIASGAGTATRLQPDAA